MRSAPTDLEELARLTRLALNLVERGLGSLPEPVPDPRRQ
jgi:hypothetical protein